MRKKIIFLTLIIFFFLSFDNLSAQQYQWKLQNHSPEFEKLNNEIDTLASEGYLPFALTYNEDRLLSLFVRGPGIKMSRWELSWYRESDEIKAGLDDHLENGFIPFAVAQSDLGLFIFYVDTGWKTEQWTFVQSEKNKEKTIQALQPYLEKKFVPVGVTEIDNKYWVLLIQQPDRGIRKIYFDEFEVNNDAIQKGINALFSDGFLPYGMTLYENKLHIISVSFL